MTFSGCSYRLPPKVSRGKYSRNSGVEINLSPGLFKPAPICFQQLLLMAQKVLSVSRLRSSPDASRAGMRTCKLAPSCIRMRHLDNRYAPTPSLSPRHEDDKTSRWARLFIVPVIGNGWGMGKKKGSWESVESWRLYLSWFSWLRSENWNDQWRQTFFSPYSRPTDN